MQDKLFNSYYVASQLQNYVCSRSCPLEWEKKAVKTVQFLGIAQLTQDDGEFLTNTATYLNYCKMLWAYSVEPGWYKRKNLRASK